MPAAQQVIVRADGTVTAHANRPLAQHSALCSGCGRTRLERSAHAAVAEVLSPPGIRKPLFVGDGQ